MKLTLHSHLFDWNFSPKASMGILVFKKKIIFLAMKSCLKNNFVVKLRNEVKTDNN